MPPVPPPLPIIPPSQSTFGAKALFTSDFDNPFTAPIVVDSRFANDFVTLLTRAGVTIAQTAKAIGVEVQLLINVAQKRQPLPLDVAVAIVNFLGFYSLGDVLGAAGIITTQTGPQIRVPIPVDPLDGTQMISFGQLGRTQPGPMPGPMSEGMIVAGFGICTSGTEDGYVLIDPTSSTSSGVVAEGPFPILGGDPGAFTPGGFCFGPGGKLFAGGGFSVQRIWETEFGVPTKSFDAERHTDNVDISFVSCAAYEATTGTIWFGCCPRSGFGPAAIYVVRDLPASLDPLQDPEVSLITPISGFQASTFAVLAAYGKVYATGSDEGRGNALSPKGALYEIDPSGYFSTFLPTRVSDPIGNPRGMDHDGLGHFVVADDQLNAWHVVYASFPGFDVNFTIADLPHGFGGGPMNCSVPLDVLFNPHTGEWWATCLDGLGNTERLVRFTMVFSDNPSDLSVVTVLLGFYTLAHTTPGTLALDSQGRVWHVATGDGVVEIIDPRGVAFDGDPTVRAFQLPGQLLMARWL